MGFLDYLDWFTPASALVREWLENGETASIPYDCLDMTAYDLKDHLASLGIETWGYSHVDGEVLFSFHSQDRQRLMDALYTPGGLHGRAHSTDTMMFNLLTLGGALVATVIALLAVRSTYGESAAVIAMLVAGGGGLFIGGSLGAGLMFGAMGAFILVALGYYAVA